MPNSVKELRSTLFAHVPKDWEVFHQLIGSRLTEKTTALEVGCGKGNICPFPWSAHSHKWLVGIDPDPAAAINPFLDRFVLLKDPDDHKQWPVEPEAFDLVIARYVLEHVEDPLQFLQNVHRALKPGGEFVFLTPNLLHPAIMISRLLPHRIKGRLLATSKEEDVDAGDIFRTHYRLNTPRALRLIAELASLKVIQISVHDFQAVEYLDFSAPTFWLAYAYHRFLKQCHLERALGCSITGVLGRGC